jgi:hypothetical protein
MAAAHEREAPADPVSAGHPLRLAGRCRGRTSGDEHVCIHFTGDILIEEGGDVAAVAADHRAPPDRAIGHGERLDDADLHQRIQFRTAPGARHRHAEDAGFLHRRGNRLGNSPARFYLLARRSDLLREPDRGMQNGRISQSCFAREICHR